MDKITLARVASYKIDLRTRRSVLRGISIPNNEESLAYLFRSLNVSYDENLPEKSL